MARNKRQNFMQGALILMIGGLLVKVIGAIFKIPLTNKIGADGMSLFNQAYDIYTWLYIITTAGLPVAVSRMVAESRSAGKFKQAQKILRIAFLSFFVLGIIATGAMIIFSHELASLLSNPDAYFCIMLIAPAILFEVIMSAYRGYFQGCQNMTPTAISQIIVAVVKLGLGYALACILADNGYDTVFVAGGAIFGVTAGTFLGALYLFIKRLFSKRDEEQGAVLETDDSKDIFKKMLAIVIPVTIGSSVLSVTNLVDSAVVMGMLQDGAGLTYETAKLVYGSYSSLARTLFNLPTALIVPLGVSVLPTISERFSSGRLGEANEVIQSAIRLTMMLALPSGFGLAFLSKPILSLLYTNQVEIDIAAPLLTELAPAIIFVCLVSITNNMLQAIGKEKVPVVTMLIGGFIKVLLSILLVGNPAVAIKGAPISTNICYAIITLLNMLVLVRALGGVRSIFKTFLKCLAAGAACGISAWLITTFLAGIIPSKLLTVAAICVGALVYFVLLGLLGGYNEKDILMLPKGEKIKNILAKIGWIG